MRSVIVDFARKRQAERRGGDVCSVTLHRQLGDTLPAAADEIVHVHEALDDLAHVDARLAQVVEMRYFAGLTEAEIAQALGITERTVRRDWEKARAAARRARWRRDAGWAGRRRHRRCRRGAVSPLLDGRSTCRRRAAPGGSTRCPREHTELKGTLRDTAARAARPRPTPCWTRCPSSTAARRRPPPTHAPGERVGPYRLVRAARARRHGRGVARRARRRRCSSDSVALKLPLLAARRPGASARARARHPGRARPSAHRAPVRRRRRRLGPAVPGARSTSRASAIDRLLRRHTRSTCATRLRPVPAGGARGRVRACAPRRASRPEAAQHPRHARRPGAAARFRHRQAAGRRRREQTPS